MKLQQFNQLKANEGFSSSVVSRNKIIDKDSEVSRNKTIDKDTEVSRNKNFDKDTEVKRNDDYDDYDDDDDINNSSDEDDSSSNSSIIDDDVNDINNQKKSGTNIEAAIVVNERKVRRNSIINLTMLENEKDINNTEINKNKKESIQKIITVSQLHHLGLQKQNGYMMKQTKLLGIWKKKFFVMKDNYIVYYNTKKDFENEKELKDSKKINLYYNSRVSIVDGNCLLICSVANVKYSQENEANNLFWILKFEDKHELEIWKVFINSHIYWCYLNNIKQNEDDINKYNLFLNNPIYNNSIIEDYWNEGLIKKEFYEYIHDVDVNKDGQIKGKTILNIHFIYL
jgi:hypothetical protein